MNTKEWMTKTGWIDSGVKAIESKGGIEREGTIRIDSISVVAGEKYV